MLAALNLQISVIDMGVTLITEIIKSGIHAHLALALFHSGPVMPIMPKRARGLPVMVLLI